MNFHERIKQQIDHSSPGQRDASFYYSVFNQGKSGELLQGKTVLDVGSRDSNFVDTVNSGITNLAIGLDPDYEHIKPASKYSKTVGVVQYLPFINNVFDEVVASHTLMFIDPEDIPNILLEMTRVTKTFGHIKVYPVNPYIKTEPSMPSYMNIEYYSNKPADTWYTLDIINMSAFLSEQRFRIDLENLVRDLDFNPSIYQYLPARKIPILSRAS